MAEFPFYAVYDRNTGAVTLELGATTSTDGKGTLGIQIAISIIIVIILFAMLVYLIFLRRKRIKAEEWLEQHKNTLFSQSANLKTEEEILEALVKSKDLKEMLELEAKKRLENKNDTAGASQNLLGDPGDKNVVVSDKDSTSSLHSDSSADSKSSDGKN